jgi:hypothetical protein
MVGNCISEIVLSHYIGHKNLKGSSNIQCQNLLDCTHETIDGPKGWQRDSILKVKLSLQVQRQNLSRYVCTQPNAGSVAKCLL